MNNEIWKAIEGFEGQYEVSNLGNIRIVGKTEKEPRLRKLKVNTHGYIQVALSKYGKKKYFEVQRLVAKAFLPNPENLPVVNHKDQNPKNNNVDNLEWTTYEYNAKYGTALQRRIFTRILKKRGTPKVKEDQIIQSELTVAMIDL